ncbi:hypothetical protein KKE68_02395 [Patescibacteria group bacterium]|nr:hypothetical protein [Patescibacteria group bacterium]
MKKPLLLITFFIIFILSLSIIQVGTSSKLSTTGIELEEMQSQINKYKKENMILEEKVLENSALINISKKAKKLGFIQSRSQIYLSNTLPFALNQ